uniref:WD domain, G-beta repeat, putative n=1 Tax=Theileria annulata TaxID=5874 RepID=A0A3B0MJ11_THEAN
MGSDCTIESNEILNSTNYLDLSKDVTLDHNYLDYTPFNNIPSSSGGYIVGERPVFLKNSIICVINNQKCILYNALNGNKVSQTHNNPDLLIGCKSFTYEESYEFLLCSSSDGTILCYNIPQKIEDSVLPVLFKLKVKCRKLLTFEVNAKNGNLLCLIINRKNHVKLLHVKPNYEMLVYSNEKVQSNRQNYKLTYVGSKSYHEKTELLKIESNNVDLFASNNDFSRVIITYRKCFLLFEQGSGKCHFYEHSNVINSITMNKGSVILGDLIGQIIVIDYTNGSGTANMLSFSESVINFKRLSNMYHNNVGNKMVYKKVSISLYHWHSHNVNSLCFYKDKLLSGGEEAVLVVWDLKINERKFVTNLGGPIFHISCSQEHIAVTLQDNTVLIIDPVSLIVVKSITSLINTSQNCILKLIDNHKICAVNDKTIQVYDYYDDKQVSTANINRVNYVSRQDQSFGINYKVTNICISFNYVLVALKRQLLSNKTFKLLLQFFVNQTLCKNNPAISKNPLLDINNQNYVLNNTINDIHQDSVTSIKQLNSNGQFISSSLDGNLNVYTRISEGYWVINQVITYKELPIHGLKVTNNIIIATNSNLLSIFKNDSNGVKLIKTIKTDFEGIKKINNENLLLYKNNEVDILNIRTNAREEFLKLESELTIRKVIYRPKDNLLIVVSKSLDTKLNLQVYSNKEMIYQKYVSEGSRVKLVKPEYSAPLYCLLIFIGHNIEVLKICKRDSKWMVVDQQDKYSTHYSFKKLNKVNFNYLNEFINALMSNTGSKIIKDTLKSKSIVQYEKARIKRINLLNLVESNQIPTPNQIINQLVNNII